MNANQNHSAGQALVEIALIAPILVFLLMITVDFGRAYHSYTGVVSAARLAAEYGSDHTRTDAQILAVAAAESNGTLTPVTVTVSPTGSRSIGTDLTVTASMPFVPVTPMISDIIGTSVTLSSTSIGRCY